MRLALALLLSSQVIGSAQVDRIPPGAAVYIEQMSGYETYLTAALVKKQVPLLVVVDKSKAAFIITSTISHQAVSQPAIVINNTNVSNGREDAWGRGWKSGQDAAAAREARGATSSSISVVDARTSQVVFAYSVNKAGSTHQIQSAAEACAKHLKQFIEKSDK